MAEAVEKVPRTRILETMIQSPGRNCINIASSSAYRNDSCVKSDRSDFFNTLGYKRKSGPCRRHVCFAPDSRHSRADVRFLADDFSFTLESGLGAESMSSSAVDPMYGPTVRCKGEFGDGLVVLRQCIRPRRGASLLRATIRRLLVVCERVAAPDPEVAGKESLRAARTAGNDEAPHTA